MNCLVLGGAGFLGSYLVPALVRAGCKVVVYDRSSRARAPSGEPHLRLVRGELSNEAALAQVLCGIDVVYHLAGKANPQVAEDDPYRDFSNHVLPTVRLLELVCRAGVKKVVYFSSGGTVYGLPESLPIPEAHPTKPICALGVRNCVIEQYLHRYHYLHRVDYAVLRVANAYGERQRADRRQGAVAVFTDCLLRGKVISLWGNGRTQRDFLNAADAATAAVSAAQYQGPEKVFNVGSGAGVTLVELIEQLCEATGCSPQLRFLPARRFDVPANVLDITRAQRCLGWYPKISLPEGLAGVVAQARRCLPLANASQAA